MMGVAAWKTWFNDIKNGREHGFDSMADERWLFDLCALAVRVGGGMCRMQAGQG